MITIKAPIDLSIRTDYLQENDTFAERITGNYELMGLEIGEEELLHMVSAPPEIYIAEGSSMTVGGNTFFTNRNEEKFNIVNNMLNRILLSVDGHLTYQDRTYITDTLYKLGIKDDRKFMSEVRKLITESHLEENFLDNYFELKLGGERKEIRERTMELTKEILERESYEAFSSREDFLSESIMNRLQTGAIYQIVANFNKSLNDTRIELQETMVSEQENIARKLLVQNFLTSFVKETSELVYREEGGTGAESGSMETGEAARTTPPESVKETVTTERTETVTERETEIVGTEQTAQGLRERILTESEKAETVLREEESREVSEQSVLERLEERLSEQKIRDREAIRTDRRSTERLSETERTETRTEGEKTETVIREEGPERLIPQAFRDIVSEELLKEKSTETLQKEKDFSSETIQQTLERELQPVRTEFERTELIHPEAETETPSQERDAETPSGESVTRESTVIREQLETERQLRERLEQERLLRETERRETETITEREGREAEGQIPPTERPEGVITEEKTVISDRRETGERVESTERYVTEQGEILRTEHEGAEMIFREEKTTEEPGTEVFRERSEAERYILEKGRILEQASREQPAERTFRESGYYRRDNIYEKELLEKESTRTEVTEGLASAVLLDVVKNLFYAGYERISKGDTWIEYRGALYHTSENTFNRLNYNLGEAVQYSTYDYQTELENVNIEHPDITELQEITENTEDIQTIENTIREMDEMNLQNVERYEKMLEVLREARSDTKRSGGKEKTRQDALSYLDDEQSLYESLKLSENAQEQERREVFHEIANLFPENSVEVFRVVERYLSGQGVPENVNITRNNIEAAADEIRRISIAQRPAPEPVIEEQYTESGELVYRRNDHVSEEQLQEVMENLRRVENKQKKETEQRQNVVETQSRNVRTFINESESSFSREETEDIEELVSRGVRAHMGMISEQVLQKLEKKLRNEKSRRGI